MLKPCDSINSGNEVEKDCQRPKICYYKLPKIVTGYFCDNNLRKVNKLIASVTEGDILVYNR